MQILKFFGFALIIYALLFYVSLSPVVVCSSSVADTISHSPSSNHKNKEAMQDKLSHQMTSSIILHGVLLWVSMGLLMPMGILAIRMTNKFHESGRKIKVFFYIHVIFQILAVLLATAGAIMSLRTLENSFNNSHQRLGLAVYAAMWLHFLTGVFKPSRECKRRVKWYIVHWMLGTIVSLVGLINIYTGIRAYQNKTSRDTGLWTILFTAELSCLVFFYLFQDKWEYFQKQRVADINTTTTTTNSNSNPNGNDQIIQVVTRNQASSRGEQKILVPQPCGKRNALMNLFE